ncbi:MAG: HIT family protein [Thermoplasmata archaeon]
MTKEDESKCVFCRIVEGKSPVSLVYEDDKVIVFPDLYPVNDGQMVVIPKKHIPYLKDLDEETHLHITKIARKVSDAIIRSDYKSEGINWFIADGEEAGQEIFHHHLILVPRFEGDGFEFKYDKKKHFIRREREQLDKVAEDIRALL